MSVVVEMGGTSTMFTKGASELVLKTCSKWFNEK